MRQPKSNRIDWLTLGEAASRLNVHPTTLRRWADEGRIPFMLTPGRHRRFAASDVDHLAERRHSVRPLGPVERIWADQALERTRREIAARSEDTWLQRYDDEARDQNRLLGRQLMAVTLRYLTGEEENESLIEEARRIGRQYGHNARKLGLPVAGALQASMFFRDTLVVTAIGLPDNVRIPPGSQIRLLNRINSVLNAVQLGVAEVYDDDRT